ncbi:MAG: hypothetical protein E7573_11250 [Ruminococcaceae bacterium]|nr:hypothetical protein [Oscillospiraceae bacterium]MBR3596625.1 hypothetical protein [Clostridia bacterium]
MNTSKSDILKYVGAAAAVGGTVLLGSGLMSDKKSVKKKMKKTAAKAVNAMDTILTGMQNIMK